MADQIVSKKTPWAKEIAALRKVALQKPGAFEDNPWGHVAFKAANKKMFVATGEEGGTLHVTFKLPHSSEAAVTMFGFCAPTGYGLGKSGWVTASFAEGADAPVSMKLALRYMNSASTKMVFQMMAILDGYAAKGRKITILFEHDPDDDMMIEFADDLKLDYTWLSFSICEIA